MILLVVVALIATTIDSTTASAQSASQRFVVRVPEKVNVVAPAESSVIAIDDSDSQTFPRQNWTFASNSSTGLVADFSVDRPFTDDSNSLDKHDAELRLRVENVAGEGQWAVSSMVDATAHHEGKDQASVRVTADSKGTADIKLNLEFKSSNEPAIGRSHSTTIICTVATP